MRRAILLALFLTAGCATPVRVAPDDPKALEPRALVVVAHGVFPDGVWNGWVEEVAAGVEAKGACAAGLDYTCHLPEYLLGSTVLDAAARVAVAVDVARDAHARTGCAAELPVYGVGYSGGTRVLLDAALLGVRFRRVTFGGSPIFFASDELGDVLERGAIGRLVNYSSLTDGFVWPMIPIGIWGYGGRGADRVEDRVVLSIHGVYPFRGERERIVAEMASSFAKDEHRCGADAPFRATLAEVRKFLEDRNAPTPGVVPGASAAAAR